MIHESVFELNKSIAGSVRIQRDSVEIVDLARLRQTDIDLLIRDAVFGGAGVKALARWLIWELGQKLDARPASIHEYYMARGAGLGKTVRCRR